MKNMQRIILRSRHRYVLATMLIAHACHTPKLSITSHSEVPPHVSSIKQIKGDLVICGNISEFPDFASLESVEGDLLIENTKTLALIHIFPALRNVGGRLVIQNNEALTTLSGFPQLTRIRIHLENCGQ